MLIKSARFSLSLESLVLQTAEWADGCFAEEINRDKDGVFPERTLRELTRIGLLAAPLSQSLGGADLLQSHHLFSLLTILKHLGRGNLSIARIYEGHVNAIQLFNTFASQRQQQQCAKDVLDGKLFGIWNAEDNEKLSVERLANGSYRLSGSKVFASGSNFVRRPIVTAEDDQNQRIMCLVSMENISPVLDKTWWKPVGMKSTVSDKINFSGVVLPESSIIGSPNDYLQPLQLIGGAVRFCAAQLGAAEALMNITRAHLRQHHRCDHAYQRMRIAKMAMAIESGNLWLSGVQQQISSNSDDEKFVQYVRLMRSAIEHYCVEVLQLSQQCVGLQGLIQPHPMERVLRDLMTYLRQPSLDAFIDDAGNYVLQQNAPIHRVWRAN